VVSSIPSLASQLDASRYTRASYVDENYKTQGKAAFKEQGEAMFISLFFSQRRENKAIIRCITAILNRRSITRRIIRISDRISIKPSQRRGE
jgi:hypothetical protein